MDSLDTKFATECQIRMKWKLKEDVVRNAQGYIESDKFSSNIPGVKYCLAFYPNQNNENKAQAYLHLVFVMTTKISADFTISVQSASSKIKVSQVYEKSAGWGRILCTRDDLLNPEKKFFVDGFMEIELEGTLKAQGIKKKAPESLSLLNYLWESNDKDLKVTVDDQHMMVHKWILCANSSVFEDELKTVGRRVAKKNIRIPDFTYDIVKVAVEFCYERNITNLVNEENALDVLLFAEKYKIIPLHKSVENLLIEKLSTENVCKIANISVTANATDLQEYCICFLMKYFGKNTVINDIKKLNDKIADEVGRRSLFCTSV